MKQKIYLVTETYTENGVEQYSNAPEVWAETHDEAVAYLKHIAEWKTRLYPGARLLGLDNMHLTVRYTDEGRDCVESHYIHEVNQCR
jgi:hypothetical protein